MVGEWASQSGVGSHKVVCRTTKLRITDAASWLTLHHVVQAEGLMGAEHSTHPFARARLGEQALQTSVQWQNTSPKWQEALSFR